MIWYDMISYDTGIWQLLWRSMNTKRAALWSADTIVHLWYNMIWYDIILYHMISYDTFYGKKRSTALPSNDQYMEINIIIWCYMTSHDIIWCIIYIISYDMILYNLYHVIQYDIIWHHMILYSHIVYLPYYQNMI